MECAAIDVVVVVVWGVPGVAPAAGGAAAIVVTNKLRTRVSAVACLFLCVQAGFFAFLRLGAVPSFSPIATPMFPVDHNLWSTLAPLSLSSREMWSSFFFGQDFLQEVSSLISLSLSHHSHLEISSSLYVMT